MVISAPFFWASVNAKNARSSKKAKEDAEDTVHYLVGVDENEEGIEDEESDELEEVIDQLVKNSNAAWSFMNGALQSEPKKKEQLKERKERRKRVDLEELSRAAAATKDIRAIYDYDDGSDVEAQFVKKNHILMTEKQRKEAAIEQLNSEIHDETMRNVAADKASRLNVTRFQFMQQLASRRYFRLVLGGISKIEAANMIAESLGGIYKSSEGIYKLKYIARWVSAHMNLGHISDSKQGKHRKTFTIREFAMNVKVHFYIIFAQKKTSATLKPELFSL